MPDNPKISIIIPVKNQENKIMDCLMALSKQTLKPYEIIVVDGHSTDNTVIITKKFSVKVIFENYSTIGGARQVGVENATGDYIAFTDADCIPEYNWLTNLMNGFDNDIVGVGGGVKNIGKGLWGESIGLALNTFLGSANSVQDRVFNDTRFVKSISGCNSIYRKKDLLIINGFNTSLSLNEDTEINKRLLRIGKLRYVPNAIVLHNQNRTLMQFVKRIYYFGYSRGKNKLLDLQAIPPILAFISLIIIFISYKIFVYMILLYLIIIFFFTLKIVISTKRIQYFLSIPIIYLLEHISYTAGFWRSLL